MICYFDLLSLTWKHRRWLLKDFGIHWTEFGIEMRNQGRPFLRVYPPAKRLIAFWGRKPTGRPNNSFSPLCLLATFTVVAYLNGSKVMTSLEMRQSELPPSGNEHPPTTTTHHCWPPADILCIRNGAPQWVQRLRGPEIRLAYKQIYGSSAGKTF